MQTYKNIDFRRVADLYAAFQGSPWANAADRWLADDLETRTPGTRRVMTASREAHRRAAAWAVARRLDVIFASSGYPTAPEPHLTARGKLLTRPDGTPGRFVHVTAVPEVAAVSRAVRTRPGVASATADGLDPDSLLAAPEVRPLLSAPVMVQSQMRLHWSEPAECANAVARYASLLPSGSVLYATAFVRDGTRRPRPPVRLEHVLGQDPILPTSVELTAWWTQAGMEITLPPRDVRAHGQAWAQEALSARIPNARAVEIAGLVP